jgi:hypothetical protein
MSSLVILVPVRNIHPTVKPTALMAYPLQPSIRNTSAPVSPIPDYRY